MCAGGGRGGCGRKRGGGGPWRPWGPWDRGMEAPCPEPCLWGMSEGLWQRLPTPRGAPARARVCVLGFGAAAC